PPLTSLLDRLIPAPTSYSVVRAGSPSSIRAALAVVPPISKLIMLGSLLPETRRAQAITPAAGPDSTSDAARFTAELRRMMPPPECIISIGQLIPIDASRAVSALA